MPPPTHADREDRLDEVLAGYLQAVKAGRRPGRQELLARHPDLAGELADFFADQDQFDSLARPLRRLIPPAPTPPTGLADYEVLGEIARGGMGVVYKARQVSLGRVVALKVPLSGPLASPADLARFQAEAEAVAALDHPHIVPIHEVGAAEDGQPFLCMKFLEGGSLADARRRGEWPARDRAGFRRAAELVRGVAGAVHYAHQRGVLHRDLKPANVLLDAQGRPHVSDFGLARRAWAGQTATPDGSYPRPTGTGTVLGTPGYMAPEQARGKPEEVTVAADVYGLGSILYELLTGRPPFAADNPLETLRRVLDEEPAPPRATVPGLDRDLETVCLKCLQKEPGKRYASAGELADDLGRYLRGEPIHARPVGPLGRWWRWCRRQPVVAGLTAALLLSMATGLVLTSWQWYRADEHAREAEARRTEAEARRVEAEENLAKAEASFRLAHGAVNDFCLYFNQELQHVPGLHGLRRELLDSALGYHQRFLEMRGHDPSLRRELADVHMSMGRLQRLSGDRAGALASYRRGVEIYRELAAESGPADPEGREARVRFAGALNDLATLQPNADDTLKTLHEAREAYERFLKETPGDRRLRAFLATTLGNLGSTCCATGRLGEGRRWFEKARSELEALIGEDPDDLSLRGRLADTLGNLAVLLDRYPASRGEALKVFEKNRDLRAELARDRPDNPERQAALASAHHLLAKALRDAGQEADAEAAFAEAHRLRAALTEKYPEVPAFQGALAQGLTERGIGLSRRGKKDEARACYEQARDLQQALVRRAPGEPAYRKELALSHFNVGVIHGALDRRPEEREAFRQARALQEALVRGDPESLDLRLDLGRTLQNLAVNHWVTGDRAEASALLRRALDNLGPAARTSRGDPRVRSALGVHLGALSEIERERGRLAEALELLGRRRELWAGDPGQLYRVGWDLARAGAGEGGTEEERELRKRCLDLAVEALDEAVAAGFRDAARLRSDPALAPLRGRADFARVVEEAGRGQ